MCIEVRGTVALMKEVSSIFRAYPEVIREATPTELIKASVYRNISVLLLECFKQIHNTFIYIFLSDSISLSIHLSFHELYFKVIFNIEKWFRDLAEVSE